MISTPSFLPASSSSSSSSSSSPPPWSSSSNNNNNDPDYQFELYNQIEKKNWDQVHNILNSTSIPEQTKIEFIQCSDYDTERNSFLLALFYNAPLSVIESMIRIIGTGTSRRQNESSILFSKNKYTDINAVHYACWNCSHDVIVYILGLMEGEMGGDSGREVLVSSNNGGKNAMHYICLNKNVTSELIGIVANAMKNVDGGEKAIISSDKNLRNAMHCMCLNDNVTVELINTVANILKSVNGGEEAIISSNKHGHNAMHYICDKSKVNVKLIYTMAEIMKSVRGGDRALISVNKYGWNVLHFICKNYSVTDELLNTIADVMKGVEDAGEKAVIRSVDDGRNAMHLICENSNVNVGMILTVADIMFCVENGPDAILFWVNNRTLKKEFDGKVMNGGAILEHLVSKYSYDGLREIVNDDTVFLQLPAKYKADDLIQSNAMKEVMNEKLIYGFALPILVVDLYVQITLVATVSSIIVRGTSIQPNATIVISALLPCIIWMIFRGLLQLVSRRYLMNVYNIVDAMQFSFVSITLLNLIGDQVLATSNEQSILLCATLIVWMKLLSVIGNFFYSIAVFYVAMIKMIARLVPFFITTLIVVLAFAHLFHFAGPGDDAICSSYQSNEMNLNQTQHFDDGGWTCNINDSYIATFTMLVGGEWLFLSDYANYTQLILSMLYSFIIGIILLNSIIAVISMALIETSYNSDKAFWQNRYEFLAGDVQNLQNVGSFLASFLAFCPPCFRRRKTDDGKRETSIAKQWHEVVFRPITFLKEELFKLDFVREFGDKHWSSRAFWVLWTTAIYIVVVSSILITFILGLVSCGTLWTREMKEELFFGKTDRNDNTRKELHLGKRGDETLRNQMEELKRQNRDQKKEFEQLKKQNQDQMEELKRQNQEIINLLLKNKSR